MEDNKEGERQKEGSKGERKEGKFVKQQTLKTNPEPGGGGARL